MKTNDALLHDNTDAVRRFCVEMYDVDPGDKIARSLCREAQAMVSERQFGWLCCDWGTSSGPAIWIKSRLLERGAFNVEKSEPDDIRLPVALHVFFAFIEETADMLARLAIDDAKFLIQVARSKLPDAVEVVQPIDRTAQRVTQWRELPDA